VQGWVSRVDRWRAVREIKRLAADVYELVGFGRGVGVMWHAVSFRTNHP